MSTNKVVNVLPYLAFEERPNSYIPIDLSLLEITAIINFKSNPMTLEFMDLITGSFTEEELRDSIKMSNIIKEEYYNSPFKVIYKGKPLDIITKDNFEKLNMAEVVNLCMKDKQEANKFWNKINSIAKKYFNSNEVERLLNNLKIALAKNDINQTMAIFNTIPYIGQRELAFYYYNLKEQSKNIEQQKLQRAKEE